MKFMDGTEVDKEYEQKLRVLMDDALEAEEFFTLDELEEYARKERANKEVTTMSQLPNHFFISECDGALHDTRRADWHKHPLRERYKWTHARIETVAQLKATLRAGEYAWPGGYPLYLYTRDGQALHFECVKKEFRGAIQSILWDAHDRIIECDINYEDTDLYCEYCDKKIESAYGEDENEENSE